MSHAKSTIIGRCSLHVLLCVCECVCDSLETYLPVVENCFAHSAPALYGHDYGKLELVIPLLLSIVYRI